MKRIPATATALLLALVAAPLPSPARAAGTVLEGLNYPWDIEAHGGTIFITEKVGTLGLFENGALTRLPVKTSVPILDDRGGGLLGLALRPDFAESGRVVLFQHYGTPDARLNRVIEAERSADGWRETRVLIDAIPGHPLYNGGRVAFGPDGMLYVTTGWTENQTRPQDPDSLAGKILRVTPDGDIPADNPFPGSAVWSLGHRNPQGLVWDGAGRMTSVRVAGWRSRCTAMRTPLAPPPTITTCCRRRMPGCRPPSITAPAQAGPEGWPRPRG